MSQKVLSRLDLFGTLHDAAQKVLGSDPSLAKDQGSLETAVLDALKADGTRLSPALKTLLPLVLKALIAAVAK